MVGIQMQNYCISRVHIKFFHNCLYFTNQLTILSELGWPNFISILIKLSVLLIMKSESPFQLALLRKISNLPSTSNYRSRYNQTKHKKSSLKLDIPFPDSMPIQPKITTEKDNNRISRAPQHKVVSLNRQDKSQNLTISAWRTEQSLVAKETESNCYFPQRSDQSQQMNSLILKKKHLDKYADRYNSRELQSSINNVCSLSSLPMQCRDQTKGIYRLKKINHFNLILNKQNQDLGKPGISYGTKEPRSAHRLPSLKTVLKTTQNRNLVLLKY